MGLLPAVKNPGVLSPQALRQLHRLRLNTGLHVPGMTSGVHSGFQRRPAAEFREHRRYTPGDDVRFVDWKATARQEHVFIKQNETPKDVAVTLLIDCSASMTWGNPPKLATTLALASALGYLALAQGDRLVVRPVVATGLPVLGPIRGKGQVPLLVRFLGELGERAGQLRAQADLGKAMIALGRRSPAPGAGRPGALAGGLVCVLSDLLGVGDLLTGLAALPQPAWNVAVLHLLHPAEIEPALAPGYGDFELFDIETGQKKRHALTARAFETYRQRLQAWQDDLARACQEKGALYSMISTGWSFEREILPRLIEMRVATPYEAALPVARLVKLR